jgi:hypothetical protein
MKGNTWRARGLAVALVALAAGSVAITSATAGNDRVLHFSDTSDPETNVWGPCGAVETVTKTVHGTVFFDENGNWVRTLEHAFYDSVVVGPTGKSISLDAHQNAEFTASGINTLSGQGLNVRAPGLGVLYQDVGRLVFDVTTPFPFETLFASAKSVSFEAFDPDKAGAAICAAVG